MKLIVCAIFLLSSWAFFELSYGDENSGVPVCLSKLMPCISFLHSSEQPTAVCCIPLKYSLDNDVDCLCQIFYNEGLRKSFNVTQKDVLDLPPRCGLHSPNLGKCNDSSSTPSTPRTPQNITAPSTGTSPSSSGLGMSTIIVFLFTIVGISPSISLF